MRMKLERGTGMEYTVKEMAQLAGVTPRTLRWYDQIGLLPPGRVSDAGYRVYTQAEVQRLQQILLYQQAGVQLKAIKEILDDPDYDPAKAMEEHLQRLRKEEERLRRLLKNAEATLRTLKGEYEMNDKERFEGFKRELVEQNEREYGAEIREKYGEEELNASNRKMLGISEEDYKRMQETEKQLSEALRNGVESGKEEYAQKAAELHKKWLSFSCPQYSAELHRNLADMYLADERFKAYYDKMVPGGTAYLVAAVHRYITEE